MSTYKKLYRSRDKRMIAGVCAGLGDYFGIDPTLIRLAVVAATLFGFPEFTLPAYLIMLIVVPEEPLTGVYNPPAPAVQNPPPPEPRQSDYENLQ